MAAIGNICPKMGRFINLGNLYQIMREITTELKMDSMGRVMIPKAYRDELKLKSGQLVKVIISNPYEKQEGQD